MEDFYYAGGLRALLARLGDLLDLDARTVNGTTLGENIDGAKVFNDDVIRPLDKPLVASRQPGGAARQPRARRRGHQAAGRRAAAAPAHAGRPSCSTTTTTWRRASTIRTSTSTPTRCSCCRTPGRWARPACRNGASCRSRRSCCKQGVRDMVRISDARMSGTSYGACVLHVAPESFVGGPLALVRDGDVIELDVPARRLELQVERRRARPPPRRVEGAAAPVRARLRRAVLAAHHAGQRRLRLRFPGNRSQGGGDRRAGNPLNDHRADRK